MDVDSARDAVLHVWHTFMSGRIRSSPAAPRPTLRQGSRWPISIWLVTMSLATTAGVILLATRDAPVPDSWGFRGSAAVFAIACGTIGAIVAQRRPDNVNGWLFCAIGVLFGVQALLVEYVIASVLVVTGGLPWTDAFAWILVWIWVPAVGIALVFLPLVFPTGHLLSPRWRAVAIYGVVALGVFGTAIAFAPGPVDQARFIDNPLGAAGVDPRTYSDRVLGPSSLLLGFAIFLSIASVGLRFRRASGDLRQQIKWFALAALLAGVAFAAYVIATIGGASGLVVKILEISAIVGLTSLPTMAGLAILRYRLYDIDRIISRTIAYGAISAVLVAAYAIAILTLQGPLGAVTGGDTISVAISTLVVAGLFQPLRRRVQAIVDRRFDRARIDAERTVNAFAERLRDEVDIGTVSTDLDRTVRSALHPRNVGLWIRPNVSR